MSRMRDTPVVYHYAADLLRHAGAPVALTESNVHVVKVLDELHKTGKLLTPVLIVRGVGGSRIQFNLADGYYRICASVYLDELAEIPCRMIPREAPKPPPGPEPPKPAADPAPVAVAAAADTVPARMPKTPRIYG